MSGLNRVGFSLFPVSLDNGYRVKVPSLWKNNFWGKSGGLGIQETGDRIQNKKQVFVPPDAAPKQMKNLPSINIQRTHYEPN